MSFDAPTGPMFPAFGDPHLNMYQVPVGLVAGVFEGFCSCKHFLWRTTIVPSSAGPQCPEPIFLTGFLYCISNTLMYACFLQPPLSLLLMDGVGMSASDINMANGPQRYMARIPGKPLLFPESRMTAQLRLSSLSDKEVIEHVYVNNSFQFPTRRKIREVTRVILSRLDALSTELLAVLADGPSDLARITLVYAIMKTDKLFRDFMSVVYMPAARMASGRIERSDVDAFFRMLAEQDENVASWSESTIDKLKQTAVKMLADAGLIDSTRTRRVQRPILSQEFRALLEAAGDSAYIEVLTGGDV